MFSQAIIFEHPLNERIRTFLRLEHLFDKIDYSVSKPEEWAARMAVGALLDIASMSITDIRPEILKELERYTKVLEQLKQQEAINQSVLNKYLEDLQTAVTNINYLEDNNTSSLYDNDFLKSIMQRSSIPAGSCSFDLPYYNYWLHQPQAQRRLQINSWMQDLLPIRDGVRVVLALVRNSCDPRTMTAKAGLYQNSPEAKLPIQMLRIQIDNDLALFPEVSGYKHHFCIKFMEIKNSTPPVQTERDVNFLLTCCIF